jgi:PAN domain
MRVLCGPIFGGAPVAGWAASRSVSLVFSRAQGTRQGGRRGRSANARCDAARLFAALMLSRKWGATLANSTVKFEPVWARFARARGCRIRAGGLRCALVLLWLLGVGSAGAQIGFDRPGGDYESFAAHLGDPAACAVRCDRDPRCRAWSFSYPGTVGPNATCRLKNQVPRGVANPCCAAGVRGAGVLTPHKPGIEFSIERPGGDYRTLDPPSDPAGSPCAAACQADTRCRAWTYFRPGYRGPAAHCVLKEHVTRPRLAPCCISGVVR